MLNSSVDNTFIDRLKDILASRYGKELQIRQLMNLSDTGVSTKDPYVRGLDFHIPLSVNEDFLGTAVIPTASEMDSESKQAMTQLVRMVLEPALYRWHLEQRENNLLAVSKAQVNVENLQLFGEELPDISEMEKDLRDLVQSEEAELLTQIIHLEGASETKNKKIALQMHEMTSRWAFVPFNDIKGQLHSTEDISKLGAMTVFIEKIEALNDPEQELLLEYLSEDRSADEPLFISCSQLSLNELSALENLKPNLMDELSINTFEVDRAPLTKEGLKEVLELFFLKDQPLHS